jgi:hypothetical protein
VTNNLKLRLREWLTVDEAVQPLSAILDEQVTEADVLRLALDGHLKLSVYLPEETVADSWHLPDDWDRPDNTAVNHWMDVAQTPAPLRKYIGGGVWDVPMVPPVSQQIESRYNKLRGLPPIRVRYTIGALVECPDAGVEEDLRYFKVRAEAEDTSSPPSILPAGSKFVVRTKAIIEFASGLAIASTPASADNLDEPLGRRERKTLYKIIAALSKAPKIDIRKPPNKSQASLQPNYISQFRRAR